MKKIEFIMEDLDWIENLDIPYKQDYLELAQDTDSKECVELIEWYESEKGEIDLGKTSC